MGISEQFVDDIDGVPYYRGSDIYNLFIEKAADPMRIARATFELPQMARSRLKKGDVLMSIVGAIIGNVSLVSEDNYASCSCKLAILRPHSIRAEFLSVFLSSYFGQVQIQKFKRGAAQTGLILEDFDQLQVPSLSETFESKIVAAVNAAYLATHTADATRIDAEKLLLVTLGIANFSPPSEMSNVKTFSQSFGKTGRLDAEYFQPKYDRLLATLSRDGMTIGDVAPVRHDRFQNPGVGNFEYIEIGGMRGDGTVAAETVACTDAPSRASQLVRRGDIVTSTVRPIRRLSAVISQDQDDYICSSGFVVLQPKHIAAEVLLVYLRLTAICELMDLHTSASLYPAISEKDLLGLPIPKISPKVQKEITTLVRKSFTLKAQSQQLLEAAKRAVEIAIEQDEAAGMAYLAQTGV